MSKYELKYLPLFWEDLFEAVSHIKNVLHNETAAQKLLDKTEKEILNHLEHPTIATKYKSKVKRKDTYYWFSVGNYMVFYVVTNNTMEVRRFIYGARDITKITL